MSKSKSTIILTVIAILIILGTVFGFVSLDDGQLGIYNYTAYPKAIKLGLDLKGGVYAVYEANEEDAEDLADRLEGTALSMQELLVSKGYTESQVVVQDGNRIRIEVPDVDDPDQIFTLIGRPSTLEFRGPDEKTVLLTGADLTSAYPTTDENGAYAIGLQFNSDGTKKFADATSKYVNQKIYIYIDGEKAIEPTVNTTISDGKAIITGNYTYDTAEAMSIRIQAGAFDVKLKMLESKTISPTLGEGALQKSLIAGAIGLAFIFVFLCVLYRMFGLAASLALIIYTLNLLFFFSIFPWVQLTLPGIAGVIIGIGMAVDGNIIIFERIKEEYRSGKSIGLAVQQGFKKSISAILDGNITTLFGTVVLWIFGAATIKGFAITLFISIILSLITSLLVTRLFIKCFMAYNSTDGRLYNLVNKGGSENE